MTAETFPTTLERRIPGAPYGYDSEVVLTVKVRLTKLEGNSRPYFSVTGSIDSLRGVEIAGGCLHDEILQWFPELADVVALHLADDRGKPMHAAENARYWMGLSSWSGKEWKPMAPRGVPDLETDSQGLIWAPVTLAKHLRISVEDARRVREYVVNDGNDTEAIAFHVRMLEKQWQHQADEVKERFGL